MNLKEFKKLNIGDLVVSKKKRARVVTIDKYLAEIEYVRSGYKI